MPGSFLARQAAKKAAQEQSLQSQQPQLPTAGGLSVGVSSGIQSLNPASLDAGQELSAIPTLGEPKRRYAQKPPDSLGGGYSLSRPNLGGQGSVQQPVPQNLPWGAPSARPAEPQVVQGHLIKTSMAKEDLPKNAAFLGTVSRIQGILDDRQ